MYIYPDKPEELSTDKHRSCIAADNHQNFLLSDHS